MQVNSGTQILIPGVYSSNGVYLKNYLGVVHVVIMNVLEIDVIELIKLAEFRPNLPWRTIRPPARRLV